MAENAEVGSVGGGNFEDETIKRSPVISKNLNRATGYLTLEAKLAFTQLRKAFIKAPIF